jgi:HpaII restriction endonuclease
MIQEKQATFVNLSNKVFAEYVLIYRVNDGYSISDLKKFKSKHQLFFQRIESINQQLNLIFVDSVFTNILADLVLEVFINKANCFNDYINSKYKIRLIEDKHEESFFKYKFNDFIHMLLYCDIASNKIYDGVEHADRVYCLKNKMGEIEYYSIYEQFALQSKLLEELILEINLNSSTLSNQEVRLSFNIRY